jgi:hypothetical protein
MGIGHSVSIYSKVVQTAVSRMGLPFVAAELLWGGSY